MTSSKVIQHKPFRKDVVTKCLTDKCEECTGSYINRILDHRLICSCPCGHVSGKQQFANKHHLQLKDKVKGI